MNQRFSLIVAGDPDQRTGGYLYDAHIVEALRAQHWAIEVIGLEGTFPDADESAARALEQTLANQPDGAAVVIDGLAMGALPDVVARHTERLAITALVHHPLGDELGLNTADQQRLHRNELHALAAVPRIIVTSHFTARRLSALADDYAIPLRANISVVEPGVEQAPVSPACEAGESLRLLCVATLTPRKGQDVLIEALAGLDASGWRCDCYGGARDAEFTLRLQYLVEFHDLEANVTLHGECDSDTLEAAYQRAHALVLPSWYEGYGMVVTEALAHGLPVITTTGGALRDTLPAGAGLSVEPGDVEALQHAIEQFCNDAPLRASLRQGAIEARQALNDWQDAATAFAGALTSAPVSMASGSEFAASWLALREPVDRAARSQRLAMLAGEWLAACPGPYRLVDLGCGRGSNVHYLAPRLPGPQTWTLIDHDATLLSEARARLMTLRDADGQSIVAETQAASFAHLDTQALNGAHLITASALLDLVSERWIDALVAHCARHRQGLLMALSVSGEWWFTDRHQRPIADDEDRWVLELFCAHQQRDKGLGEAQGGHAHATLAAAFEGVNYRIEEANTPWQLSVEDAAHRPLMASLIDGWATAASEHAPEAAVRIANWAVQRCHAVASGELGIWVGHRDLLALPMEVQPQGQG
ncbi:glycosyltransferase [Halomonas sp. HL-93]|uniref:glycosyltransferase n=1 Tax=Halomonas sp. HL-93 TaxID=1666906 RepID=UPI0006DA402E|nr:glycosyltransferase [Halomonas sp. HL-93]KPQ21416.1 MAG: family 4 glycosyltransferase [Halomonas sp. HL-93]SBR47267.1 Glycosyltransferase involved in cell wall bisynthesis [Halomonas sp. HL-93]